MNVNVLAVGKVPSPRGHPRHRSSYGRLATVAARRVQATMEDGTLWKYDYNDRNELIDAKRFWADWTPYSGQQFGYLFDTIGNRMKAWEGGDNQGGNLREIQYSANELNQYTNILTPGYKHIAGVAFATNTVTVNSGAAERRGEWFDREIAINNSGSPVWQTVAAVSANVTSNGGFAFPKNQQALSYDEDGNLTQDGIWTYEWDAENRLITMGMTDFTGLEASNRLRLDFAYDYMGRRFSKTVSTWDLATETFTNAPTQYFVYDLGGWNLLATLNSQLSILNSFLWGQDLSGTLDEAGGVGGLLGVFEISNPQITNGHFTMYDGNGNITGLIKADKTASARYEYSPFGETLRATGPIALANPFRFSTKFHDNESGLVYYGQRYYSQISGRWLGRDPIGEEDGAHLYIAFLNLPIGNIDPDGRKLWGNPKVGAILAALGTLFNASVKGMPSRGPMMQWALRIKVEAQAGSRRASIALGGKGTGGNGVGFPGRTIIQYRGTPWAVAMVGVLATFSALEAGANVALGMRSADGTAGYALEASLVAHANGDTAWGDLHAIEAALLITGGVASDALVAWDTFDEAAAAFSAGCN